MDPIWSSYRTTATRIDLISLLRHTCTRCKDASASPIWVYTEYGPRLACFLSIKGLSVTNYSHTHDSSHQTVDARNTMRRMSTWLKSPRPRWIGCAQSQATPRCGSSGGPRICPCRMARQTCQIRQPLTTCHSALGARGGIVLLRKRAHACPVNNHCRNARGGANPTP